MTRIEVLKTYKLYIGGKFPRTESGRYYTPLINNKQLGNICLASKKDVRNATVAARSALGVWSAMTAYNRSQVLYRIAEMMEGRKAQFIAELIEQGSDTAQAQNEVDIAIDRIIYYAGWCDKYTQFFSAVNPVATSHFNFTMPEPVGIVAILAPQNSSLLGLVSAIMPVMASANSCVVLASKTMPLCSITFAEVLNSSDVPGGVVNILTGTPDELLPVMSSHMDINSVLYCGENAKDILTIRENAVNSVKRVVIMDTKDLVSDEHENPWYLENFLEMKTTWHPIEKIGPPGSSY